MEGGAHVHVVCVSRNVSWSCLCVICNVLEHELRGKKISHVDILVEKLANHLGVAGELMYHVETPHKTRPETKQKLSPV